MDPLPLLSPPYNAGALQTHAVALVELAQCLLNASAAVIGASGSHWHELAHTGEHLAPDDCADLVKRARAGETPVSDIGETKYAISLPGREGWHLVVKARHNAGASDRAWDCLRRSWATACALAEKDSILSHSESIYRSILDNLAEVVFQTDCDGKFVYLNEAWHVRTGHPVSESLGRWYGATVDITDPQALQQLLTNLVRSKDEVSRAQLQYRHRDGTERWVEVVARPTLRDGVVCGVTGSLKDVTERRRHLEEVELGAQVYRLAREGIIITDARCTIVDVNAAFERITGYARDEVVGSKPSVLSSGCQQADFYRTMWQTLAKQGYWEGELWNRRKDGSHYAELLTISAVLDEYGQVRQYVGVFSDITYLKAHERELEEIAFYDALTHLPNRRLLGERMRAAMAGLRRTADHVAIIYVDLDGFKLVNDEHGHAVGDELLRSIAQRLAIAVRTGDTVCRLGGDEFVILLAGLASTVAALPSVERIVRVCAEPVSIGSVVLRVSASVGVAFYPQGGCIDADLLLRQADQAMYEAKINGKNCYRVFNAERERVAVSRSAALERIGRGLRDNEFVLFYQPIVNLGTGALVSVEALIRWQHPEQGLLYPAAFLPALEDSAMAIAVGDWVMRTALAQLKEWDDLGLSTVASINVSGNELLSTGFAERVQEALTAFPAVCPSRLKLEILETSALADVDRAAAIMRRCTALGVQFALDDFGTGYSSLMYLKRLPLHQLKIDQSFVRGMLADPADRPILEGVIELARAFQLKVVAEGVETEDHAHMMLELGCPQAQGFGIAMPMPGDELILWARKGRPGGVAAPNCILTNCPN